MGDTRKFFELPTAKLADFRSALDECEGNDPDATLASCIVTQIYTHCTQLSRRLPKLCYDLHADSAVRATLRVQYVPAIDDTCIDNIMALGNRISGVRFVFEDSRTAEPLTHGTIIITLWRSATPIAQRVRMTHVWPKIGRSPTFDIDYSDLDIVDDGEDAEFVKSVMIRVSNMQTLMTQVRCSAEKIVPNAIDSDGAPRNEDDDDATASEHIATAKQTSLSGHVRRRTRGDDALASKRYRNGYDAAANARSSSVGCCLFFENVPSFNADMFARLRADLGNRILRVVLVSPSRWTSRSRKAGSAGKTYNVAPMLAVSVRLSKCREAEAGPYAVSGCVRLQRAIERSAKSCMGD